MENNWRFHNSRLSAKQYEQAISELEGGMIVIDSKNARFGLDYVLVVQLALQH